MYNDEDTARTWALLVLAILDAADESTPIDPLRVLQEHANHCTAPSALRDLIYECSVIRTWAGNACLIRLAVSAEMQQVAAAAWRLCVAFGGLVKYGPAPRGPLERAASSLLTQQTKRTKF